MCLACSVKSSANRLARAGVVGPIGVLDFTKE
jgi:hypothetical protein